MHNKRKAFFDVILNIFASSIPTITLQLIILPLLARSTKNEAAYGLILTLVSAFTLSFMSFGSPLNNTRLLLNKEYKDKKVSGDFNIILMFSTVICSVFSIVSVMYYDPNLAIVDVILIVFITIFAVLSNYFVVSFRLVLNYQYIFFNSLFQALGYLAGYALYYFFGHWPLIYLCGYISSFIYIAINSDLLKEPFKTTKLFPTTIKYALILIVTSFVANANVYVDRLLLYPLLGGQAVSIYYVATVFGKSVSLIVSPISGVMLSYFSRMSSIRKNDIFLIIISSGVVGVVAFIVCIVASNFFLPLLYPEVAIESLRYIYITTATAIIGVLSMIISPIVMKFRSINWQIFINAIDLAVYLALSFVLSKKYGLVGFCFGALGSVVFKFAMLIIIALKETGEKSWNL